MSKSTSKSKQIIAGRIFAIFTIINMIVFIISAVLIQPMDFTEFLEAVEKDLPLTYVVVFCVFISIISSFIAFIILGPNWRHSKVFDKILCVISSPPILVVGLGILIIVGIRWFIMHLPSESTSSSSYTKTVNVRDKAGYDSKLEWDKHTETWRDVNGNQYVTKDEGKTFTRK